ncbi:MAG: hypothetical protein ACYDEH_04800 [Acidimicrobiales bacterium]
MITHEDVAVAEYLLNDTGAHEALRQGLLRSTRGRKPNDHNLRLLTLGLFLSIQDRGVATVQGAFRVLTEDLPLDEQLRLGVRRTTHGKLKILSKCDLYYQAERISVGLTYGEMSSPGISDAERARRHQVITDFSNILMDAFDLGWDDSIVAVDETGIWSWARGGKSRKKIAAEVLAAENAADAALLVRAAEMGEVPGLQLSTDGDTVQTAANPEATKKEERPRRKGGKRKPPTDPMDPTTGHDDGLGLTLSADPDGYWAMKTKKTGGREVYFGYSEHTLVLCPRSTIEDDPRAQPAIIRRLELTTASTDVVDVTLRMLDSLPVRPKHLLGDRHYHYKDVVEWKDQLTARGIKQHHDLREDEQGIVTYERMPFIGGCGHCPAMTLAYGDLRRCAVNADESLKEAYRVDNDERQKFALRVVNQPKQDGAVRLQCPALAGTVGCSLRPGTVAAAISLGLPIIENPPNEVLDGEPLPRCCTQKTVKVTPPDAIRKLQQPYYHGSRKWEGFYGLRTYVEGSYGGRKNTSTENLRRGLFQRTGLPWANLVVSLTAASYNLRLVQNWHERSGDGDPNHPLLRNRGPVRPWLYLTEDEVTNFEEYFRQTQTRS